jgi:hypothetical protein
MTGIGSVFLQAKKQMSVVKKRNEIFIGSVNKK